MGPCTLQVDPFYKQEVAPEVMVLRLQVIEVNEWLPDSPVFVLPH